MSYDTGGGLYVFGGTVVVVNSTIADNSADNGGGGMYVDLDGDVTLDNSIVAGNRQFPVFSDIAGTLNPASSFNIIGDSNTAGGLTHGVNNNIVGNMGVGVLDAGTVLNLTLADNGGPTGTHALIPGSPAIDSGNNALALGPYGPLTTDQLGFGRFVNGTVDRGAYEYAPVEDVVGFNSTTGIWYIGISQAGQFTNTEGPRWSLDFAWDIVSGDFTGDGLADVAGRMQENGQWIVAASNGTTLINQPFAKWAGNAQYGWRNTMAGDFTGDGIDDVIAQDNTGRWWVGLSNGSTFQQHVFGRWDTEGWAIIRPADLNGDGKTDLLGYHGPSGYWWAAISDGSKFTTFSPGRWGTSAAWQHFRIADFTGDGADDVLAQSLEGYWSFAALNSGSQRLETFSAGRTSTDTSLGLPQVGDFNGDGKADLVTFSSSYGGQAWVKLSSGTGMGTAQMWSQIGTVARVSVGAADVNGDGRDDAVLFYRPTLRWMSLVSTGSKFTAMNYGSWSASSPSGFQTFFLDEFGG